ncbi:TPA: right-handed parallel beta-helix repeat-containing protein [Raoultella ornithinolytica]
MNRRVLLKQLLSFLFISPLSRAKASIQDKKNNLVELLPSLFTLNNELHSSLRYKISFFVDKDNGCSGGYFKVGKGELNILKEDIYFDKGFFYSSSGEVLNVYIYPNTPAKIYDKKNQCIKFVSDVYLGEVDTSYASMEDHAKSTDKFHKFITPEYFGAVGDGKADDTIPINETVVSGYSILFSAQYLISSSISPVDNQKFVGVNDAELILLKPNMSLIKTKGVSNVVIKGLILTSHPTLSKPYNGSCIRNEDSKGWYIGDNIFSNYGASAIFCYNSSEMLICNNKFSGIKDAAGDITMWGSSRKNKITNNVMQSGSDSAIIIQTITDGDFCSDNIIQDNNISNCTRYGIVVYNNLSSKKSVLQNTKILGNKIDNILGEVRNPSVHDTRTYGAGIYVLSAENITIQYNKVSKCNLLTNSSTLAPGCIGLNATSSAIISDNIISRGAYYGIFIGDALQQGKGYKAKSLNFRPDNIVRVQRNKITGCVRDGVFVINKHRVTINDNLISDNEGCGIATSVSNNQIYHTLNDIIITNNSSCNNGLDGINLSSANCAVISGGAYSDNLRCGVNLTSFGTKVSLLKCQGNKIGISVTDKGVKCRLEDCTLTSNDVGVLAMVPYEESGCVYTKNKLSRKVNAAS